MDQLEVIKASGEKEVFSHRKLEAFLKRIHLPEAEIGKLVEQTRQHFKGECHTHDIIAYVTARLLKLPKGRMYATRYNIKPIVRNLGPAGHNFEKYVARVMEHAGYQVEVGVKVTGKCTEHEIDVVARKDGHTHYVECKFHNREGTRSDINIGLYSYARFLDICNCEEQPEVRAHNSVWLVTNTKPTLEALRYTQCIDMHVLTIERPFGNGLLDRMINQGLFPITASEELLPYKDALVEAGYVLLSDVLKLDTSLAQSLGISPEELQATQKSAREVLETNNTSH